VNHRATVGPAAPGLDRSCSLREQKKQQTRRAIHDAACRLVMERGLPHVTVADICAEATVSERTFFNYYPSKAAAALGLPDTVLAAHDEERFLAAHGPLVDDVCVLVADTAELHDHDLPRLRELIRLEPDLLTAVKQWTVSLRKRIVELAEQRTSPERARLAVALVFAALLLHADGGYTSHPPTARELRETVARLVAVGAESRDSFAADLAPALVPGAAR
jgi:AcrR family transcriptional regulator